MKQTIDELSLDGLTVAERIVLAQRLWDSVVAENPAVSLTPSQEAELAQRMAEHERDPSSVITWDEVKAAIGDQK